MWPRAAMLMDIVAAGAAPAAATNGAGTSLFDQLSAVPFLNSGVTRATDTFFFEGIDAIGDASGGT